MFENTNIRIDSQILSLISELDEFKGSWKLLSQTAADKLRLLKKIATIESIGASNRIEGNRLSNEQIESLLADQNEQSFVGRDEQEVAGYAKLIDIVYEYFDAIALTENYIKQLHKILLEYSSKDERHRGEYKNKPNSIAAFDSDGNQLGIVFETATPLETPLKMQELIKWTNNRLADRLSHPLITIGIFVINFLAIHPFEDGNGRLSRALTSLLLMRAGYLYVPYSSHESVIEDFKDDYYKSLRQSQKNLNQVAEYEPWIIFFLRTLQRQKQRLEYSLEHFDVQKGNYLSLPTVSAKIMETIETRSRITVSEVAGATGISANTLKKHLASLVEQGYLIKHGKTKGAWYTKGSKEESAD